MAWGRGRGGKRQKTNDIVYVFFATRGEVQVQHSDMYVLKACGEMGGWRCKQQ